MPIGHNRNHNLLSQLHPALFRKGINVSSTFKTIWLAAQRNNCAPLHAQLPMPL
jgi:hypothetical protein